MPYLNSLTVRGQKIPLPIYSPDATRAVARGIDSQDLIAAGIQSVVVNTYHLSNQPGASTLKLFKGVKKFMDWPHLVISDSGGFQLLSLIHNHETSGSVNDKGVKFYKALKNKTKKVLFTPQKSIQMQFALSSDILFCLDDCPSATANQKENEDSVRRTILWAALCKKEYLKQIKDRHLTDANRPLLFAVIQGGDNLKLRETCAKELIKIGFDGFGFGGWPIKSKGELNKEVLSFTASLMPDNLPKFALGVGNPQAIVDCFQMGYNFFDCVLPTRDARHGRLYVFPKSPLDLDIFNEPVYEHLYIDDEKYVKDTSPISDFCDCFTCTHYSRSYLHHLFVINDSLAGRLATIHNLRLYSKLIEILRSHVH